MAEVAKATPSPRGAHRASIAARILRYDVPVTLAWLGALSLMLLYIFVAVHTPVMILADRPHDDGLFISLGEYLSDGQWLGPFTQFTLMKGPGYPIFLALVDWLGVPIDLAHALFHCAAVMLFVLVAQRLMRSLVLSGILFTLLLWHPAQFSDDMRRVLRDHIYFDQVLILLALCASALFIAQDIKRRLLLAGLAGAMLGWLWLTREEGAWILPGLATIALAGLGWAYRSDRLREALGVLAIIIGVALFAQLTFRAANWWHYGSFVGVDFKEANFQRAVRALDSVRSGDIKPFVSVTYDAMRRIAEVSPSFKELLPYFNGPGKGWEAFSCTYYPSSCGEIGSGWFMWALRGATAEAGHYSSPAEASAFFGKLAGQIETACARGALRCKPQFVAEMPPIGLDWLLDGLRLASVKAAQLLITIDFPDTVKFKTGGTDSQVKSALRFLHSSMQPSAAAYALSGWYYKSASDWISFAVMRPDGALAEMELERQASPDIATHFGDELASQQRYSLKVGCDFGCTLRLSAPGEDEIAKMLGDLRPGSGLAIGGGTFYVDSAGPVVSTSYEPRHADLVADRLRAAAFALFKYLYVPVVVLGVLAMLVVTLRHCRQAVQNACYVMALACWILAFSRLGLLTLIAGTSLPALQVHYFAPIYFLVVCAAVLSLAAWLQLGNNAPRNERAPQPATILNRP